MNTYTKYLTQNYYTVTLCIIIFLLPYSIAIPNIFVILLALLLLLGIISGKLSLVTKTNLKYLLPFLFIFLSYSTSTLYSENIREALSTIEKKIPILLLPFIIFSIPLKKNNIDVIFYTLMFSVVICCLAAILLTFYYFANHPEEYYLEKALWYLPQTINFHAPYLALYLVVSNIICYYFYLQKKNNRIIFVIFLVNNIFLFLISSRSALLTNWVFITALSSFHLYKNKGRFITFLNLIVIGGTLYFAYLNIPYLHTKISKLTEAAYGVNQRVVSAKAALDVIKKNPLLGVGIGDVQEELNRHLPDNTYANYSVHNQYLHEVIIYGLVGFIFFAAIFILGYNKAIIHRDLPFFLFITALLMLFLTEVILDRYKGIMLFSIFYPLFLRLSLLSYDNSSASTTKSEAQ